MLQYGLFQRVGCIARMSVVEDMPEHKVMVLCHRKFMKTLYKDLDDFDKQLELFDIRTPFRMDQEAENIAKRLEEGVETDPKSKKKKRKVQEPYPLQQEVDYLLGKQPVLTGLRGLHFPGAASVEEVRGNNRELREKVRSLATGLGALQLPGQGRNREDTVVTREGVVFPPLSSFLLCDVDQLSTKVQPLIPIPIWMRILIPMAAGAGEDGHSCARPPLG